MSWRCPACSTPIRHNDFDPVPRLHTRYRCHLCRLELILDPELDVMTLAPMVAAVDDKPPRRRKRQSRVR